MLVDVLSTVWYLQIFVSDIATERYRTSFIIVPFEAVVDKFLKSLEAVSKF
jgi:hypothetical protein